MPKFEAMYISPSYHKNPKTSNIVYLIASKKELDKIPLDKNEKTFAKKALKDGAFVDLSSYSEYKAVVTFDTLTKPENREKLRVQGYQIFSEQNKKLDAIHIQGDDQEAVYTLLEGIALSSYRFDKYFSEKKAPKLKTITTDNKEVDLDTLENILDATCWARTLVNEPVSYLTAEQLSKEIEEKCKSTGIKVDVLSKSKIVALKMGGLLAVNKGSVDPPTFTIMEWKPKNAVNKKPIILVGKGIVYDTGGLSLKPTANSMDFMKSDMAGAAAMVATTYAVAKLKLPLHIITLIPATDNRPGGNAYAPGDVIRMFNGMTVEVLNTDAEGRMALADALAYGNKFEPELVIDAATLTGAAVRAIGTFAACVMGNADQKEIDAMEAAGQKTFDRVAQLPFWDDYKEELKSTIADLKNLGGPYAGMITAGKFLEHFTDYPYIHIDLAGPSFFKKKDKYRGIGGTGAGVRLLVEYLKNKAEA